jgi:MFS family permease
VNGGGGDASAIDSPYAVMRLLVALVLTAVGGSSMYVVAVVLPAVQADFGLTRADASVPYTLLMIGLGFGSSLMGRIADRHGVVTALRVGAVGLGAGYAGAALSGGIWAFALWHGFAIGLLGGSAMFSPLIADTSLWFERRRGIAVGVCASGNYLAGAVWPPIVQHLVETHGWRYAYGTLALASFATVATLSFAMRRRSPVLAGPAHARSAARPAPFRLTPALAQTLLCIAGIACCVAMSMPQVHMVAYCGDLGYGAARGAQMLSLMLACGIVSRLASGAICDRIGGLRTLLLGSALQGASLMLFLPFDGLVPLYVISALFGLSQGGIVPSYAIVVREHFDPREAGARVGLVLTFTMFGMALGGWMSGKVFDLTGSYRAAFVNGVAWNLLNLTIAVSLFRRAARRAPAGRELSQSG